MARKGLPKKYAKMGFKKGWRAYKAEKRRPARRKTYKKIYKKRRVSVARRRKYYRKARYGGGKYKNAIDGALAGAAEGFLSQYVPIPGAIKAGIGIFRNNTTLTTLGVYQLVSSMLGGSMGGNGGGVR